jgi:hypothetical protein
MTIPFTKLHDATLEKVEINWSAATATVSITMHWEEKFRSLEICARDYKQLNVPNAAPWGPSKSINKAEQNKLDRDSELRIEMQSGDVIYIVARDFVITEKLLTT